MIKLTNLTKYYKKHARGILDISLDVTEGEIFGFIGPNGAGKSTTIRTMLNLIFPSSGNATIFDLDIVKDTIEIRKNIGYIPSEVNYYGDMLVKDFLDYSSSFYGEGYAERIDYLSKRLKLDLNKKIEDLSFGNKKKVAIVQAFVHQPKLLVLDEPTSGLDPLIQTVFFELMKEEKQRGATIFFSSHTLSEVQRVCDRVGIIREGKLIKIEKIEEILATNVKNVKLISNSKLDLESDDVRELKQVDNKYEFTYTGTINSLIAAIGDKDIIDLTITEPTLEEIFMHYYDLEDE